MDHLLRERIQQIDLAKTMYPVYDKNDSNWELVVVIKEDIQTVKNRIVEIEDMRGTINNKSPRLANEFVESICSPNSPKI